MESLGALFRWFRLLVGWDLEALAKDCEAAGDLGLAITVYRKILNRNSGFVRGWVNLGRLYEARGESDTAYSAYGAAVAAARRSGSIVYDEILALRTRARLGFETGRAEECEADFRAALRLAKQNSVRAVTDFCLDYLARIAEARGDEAKAEILRREISEVGSNQAAAALE